MKGKPARTILFKKKQDDDVMIIENPPIYFENPKPSRQKIQVLNELLLFLWGTLQLMLL